MAEDVKKAVQEEVLGRDLQVLELSLRIRALEEGWGTNKHKENA